MNKWGRFKDEFFKFVIVWAHGKLSDECLEKDIRNLRRNLVNSLDTSRGNLLRLGLRHGMYRHPGPSDPEADEVIFTSKLAMAAINSFLGVKE